MTIIDYTKVAGVCFENDDGTHRQDILKKCEKGMRVNLIPEPDNPYDENAVKVVLENTSEQLGYLNRYQAPDIIEKIKYGAQVVGIIRQITGKDQDLLGCNLQLITILEDPEEELHWDFEREWHDGEDEDFDDWLDESEWYIECDDYDEDDKSAADENEVWLELMLGYG